LPLLPIPPPSPPVSRPATPFAAGLAPTFRVLEIGSGTGLVGLAAAVVLARLLEESASVHRVELILSDFHPDVLANLAHNVDANGALFRDPRLEVRVEALDWRTPDESNVKGVFDVILGSDLVYEEVHA
jgi:predicted nicotinamide N-methyase